MTQFRTIDLPPGSYSAKRHPLRRFAPPAELLSQMLQRPHASEPTRVRETIATDAYAYTAKAAVVRMPAGYRTTVVA
jgi:hypothetical protein